MWSVLARFDRIVDWAPTVDHSEAMSIPPFGLGASRRVQVGRLTLVETVTEWAEGSALAYTIEGLPPIVEQASNRWALEAAGPDRTTVSVTLTVASGPRPSMRLAAPVVARGISRANGRMLEGLAQVVAVAAGDPAARVDIEKTGR